MTHLALIGTPGHYFNLMECITQLDLQKKNVVLYYFYLKSDDKNISFIKNHIKKEDWLELKLISVWNPKHGRIANFLDILRFIFLLLKSKFKTYSYIICNQYDVFYQLSIINIIKYQTLISMDEGNAVFRIVEERKKRLLEHKVPKFKLKKEPESITFFSSYNITVLPQDNLIECKYMHSSAILKQKNINSSKLFFIGSPYVNDGILSEEVVYQSLHEVRLKFKDKEIYYIPHRREQTYLLDKYQQDFGFKINKIDLPFERYFLEQEDIPKTTVGFATAALFNLKKITGDDDRFCFMAKMIDSNNILKPSIRKIYAKIYSEYLANGILIIS